MSSRLSGPEVARLLARAQADPDQLPEWTAEATRQRWTWDSACEAIRAHQARPTPGPITPAIVTAAIADQRAGRARPPRRQPDQPAAPPASDETRARLRTGWRSLGTGA